MQVERSEGRDTNKMRLTECIHIYWGWVTYRKRFTITVIICVCLNFFHNEVERWRKERYACRDKTWRSNRYRYRQLFWEILLWKGEKWSNRYRRSIAHEISFFITFSYRIHCYVFVVNCLYYNSYSKKIKGRNWQYQKKEE